MKKRLICFLILSSFVIGLVFVGSCKDYDDFALDIRVENLENKLDTNCQRLADTIDVIKAKLASIKSCTCDPNLKKRIDTLYKFLGDVMYDTVSADSADKKVKGLSNVINYLNKSLSDIAVTADSAYSIADSLRQLRFGWGDSLELAYDTIRTLVVDVEKINTKLDSIRILDSIIKERDRLTQIRIDSVIKVYDKADSAHQAQIDTLFKKDSLINVSLKELIKQDSVHTSRIDSLAKVTHQLDSVAKVYLDSALAWADDVANSVKVALNDRIDSVINEYKKADTLINKRIDAICLDTMRLNWARIQEINDTLNVIDSVLQSHKSRLDSIDLRLDTLELRMDSLELRVDTLELKVDSLEDARKKAISGIVIQGTKNNIYGTFALPIGIKSFVLMAYAGNVGEAKFPTAKASYDWSYTMTAKEAGLLNIPSDNNLDAGPAISEASDNAGKLFFTLNPNDVQLDSTYEFYLGNSDGVRAPVTLDSIRKAKEKLTFGFNPYKGAQVVNGELNTDNGFYQADVKIAASDIYSLRPNVTKSTFKSVANDLKDLRKDGIDLDELKTTLKDAATTALSASTDILDQYALYVSWKDMYGTHSATSGYDLAVATVEPLSFKTVDEVLGKLPSSTRIPDDPIHYLLNQINVPSFTLDFDSIKMGAVSFSIPSITFDTSAIHQTLKIYVDATGTGSSTGTATSAQTDLNGDPITADVNMTTTINIKDTVEISLDSVYINLNEKITAVMDTLQATLNGLKVNIDSIVNNIQDQLQTKVNSMLNSIESTVNDNVESIVGDIKTQIGNNKFVKKIEQLANKLKSYYGHIDGYAREMVMPTVLYVSNGDFHPVSKQNGIYTPLVGTGKHELILTSLTNEILIPAYKKSIIVTNYRGAASDNKDYQNDDNSDALNVITGVNTGDFGSVLDGDTKKVIFNAPEKGQYEILLSVIDFDGGVCHRKFFVEVQ
jgi:hypothetical protein